MVTGVRHDVTLFMDSRLQSVKSLYMHPLVNDRTVGMKPADVETFLQQQGVTVNWIDL